jgi:hypothetical protein
MKKVRRNVDSGLDMVDRYWSDGSTLADGEVFVVGVKVAKYTCSC